MSRFGNTWSVWTRSVFLILLVGALGCDRIARLPEDAQARSGKGTGNLRVVDGDGYPLTINFKADEARVDSDTTDTVRDWWGNGRLDTAQDADFYLSGDYDYLEGQVGSTNYDLEESLVQRRLGAARIADVENSVEDSGGETYFYPGHWLYRPGLVAAPVPTTLDGSSTSVTFTVTNNVLRPGDVVIIHPDSSTWNPAETAVVTAASSSSVTIARSLTYTNYRATLVDWYNSGSGYSYVALSPHVYLEATDDPGDTDTAYDDVDGAYTFNLNPEGPETSSGLTHAYEVYGRYVLHNLFKEEYEGISVTDFGDFTTPDMDISGTIGTTVPADLSVSGVVLDTGYWRSVFGCEPGSDDDVYVSSSGDTVLDYLPDVDNDGDADCGYENGYQMWGRGAMLSMMELRQYAAEVVTDGDQFRIVVDSESPDEGYRGFKHISGIEMEHFPAFSAAAFDEALSQGFQHLNGANAEIQDRISALEEDREVLSYVFTKENQLAVQCGGYEAIYTDNRALRVGAAASTIALMPHAYAGDQRGYPTASDDEECFGLYNWDEYFPDGLVDNPGWLGSYLDDPVRVANRTSIPEDWVKYTHKTCTTTKGSIPGSGSWTTYTYGNDLFPADTACLGADLAV